MEQTGATQPQRDQGGEHHQLQRDPQRGPERAPDHFPEAVARQGGAPDGERVGDQPPGEECERERDEPNAQQARSDDALGRR